MKANNGVFTYLRSHKSAWLFALLFAAGALLLVLGGGTFAKKEEPALSAEEKLEAEIEALVESVAGVGEAKILITYEEGESVSYKGTAVSATTPPKALAVSVVCDGGDDERVRAALVSMLSSLLGIGANRVSVLKKGN